METIKCSIAEHVISTYGPSVVELQHSARCVAICVQKYPEYVMYVRQDEMETHFLCHYVHVDDLQMCADTSAEMEEWKMQRVLRLARRFEGGLMKNFVPIAIQYVKDAVARIDLMKKIESRGFYTKVKTFEEARLELALNPKPRRPPPVLPPPVCKRHNDVHNEAEKKKKTKRVDEHIYLWKSPSISKDGIAEDKPSCNEKKKKDPSRNEKKNDAPRKKKPLK